eukprot:5484605-Alexandrium_andersonii.AAC.1
MSAHRGLCALEGASLDWARGGADPTEPGPEAAAEDDRVEVDRSRPSLEAFLFFFLSLGTPGCCS